MNERLHKNRIVIVGRNPIDAYNYAQGKRFQDTLESPVLMNSASHRLTILGGMPSHVGAVYITGMAPEGENFGTVEEAIEAARVRNPDLKVVEETRVVSR